MKSTHPPFPWIIGHRGASHDAPENTLLAFKLAWQQGADGIEGDFRLTSDGHIVCLHDGSTLRTTGVDLAVAETPLARLRELEAGSWKHPRFTGEVIPTLDEVLATVPAGGRIFVEIKCGPEILPALEAALAVSPVPPENITVISFNDEVIAAVKRNLPNLPACLIVAYALEEDQRWLPDVDKVLQRLADCQADGLDTQANVQVMDEAFARRLREAEMQLHVWTVDTLETARHFQQLGFDSITTNRPLFLREQLLLPQAA